MISSFVLFGFPEWHHHHFVRHKQSPFDLRRTCTCWPMRYMCTVFVRYSCSVRRRLILITYYNITIFDWLLSCYQWLDPGEKLIMPPWDFFDRSVLTKDRLQHHFVWSRDLIEDMSFCGTQWNVTRHCRSQRHDLLLRSKQSEHSIDCNQGTGSGHSPQSPLLRMLRHLDDRSHPLPGWLQWSAHRSSVVALLLHIANIDQRIQRLDKFQRSCPL